MSRKLRYFPPDSLVEVTTRTLQSRYLLPPTKHFARIIVGILARAQEKAPIRIHAIGGLASHMHLLATIDDAKQLADFMEYANGNIAREAGRVVDWRGKFWGRRYAAIPVSDEEPAQVNRIRYLLSQSRPRHAEPAYGGDDGLFPEQAATRSPPGMMGSSQNWALRLRGLFQDCTQPSLRPVSLHCRRQDD